jgi:hypothetical protein
MFVGLEDILIYILHQEISIGDKKLFECDEEMVSERTGQNVMP